MGLKSDGSVVAAGNNEFGQCNVSDWRGIEEIAAGTDHTVGRKSDGSVVAIGRNGHCQCSKFSDTDFRRIAAGDRHTVGLKSNGFVVAAGDNNFGRCETGAWALKESISAPANRNNASDRYYFPHIASNSRWETEISLINPSGENIKGNLAAYSDQGELLAVKKYQLSAADSPDGHYRLSLRVGEAFAEAEEISYLLWTSKSPAIWGCLRGYTRFYQQGRYSAAVPAVQAVNTGDIAIPHIASDENWWTGLALVNTTDSTKTLKIRFNTGDYKNIEIDAGEHRSFRIKDLLGGAARPDIKSAFINGTSGVIGLELFGGETSLSGVLLTDNAVDTLYFPHVASNQTWWTGIAAYNPNPREAELTITPYTEKGKPLDTHVTAVSAKENYLGNPEDLELPAGTAWFKIESSRPLNGFELFGTINGRELAGYSTVNISRAQGIFPKLDNQGWTGIAFVNTADVQAEIDLEFFSDEGVSVGGETISLEGYEKLVGQPEALFGSYTFDASYLQFSADREVVGFQLNAGAGNMMLDALPGM